MYIKCKSNHVEIVEMLTL